MPNQTSFLRLKKPLATEMADIAVLNGNSDIIDNEMKKINGRMRANVEYVTVSKTWRVPVNVNKIDVFVVDGGYDGASGSNTNNNYGTYGNGGKGGGMLYIHDLKVTYGQEFKIVVGAANGGKSSFGNISGQVTEVAGGSGLDSSVTPRCGKSGSLGKINNYYEGMPCPINGRYYGVSGAAGGDYTWTAGAAGDMQCGAGGTAGKSSTGNLPQGGISAVSNAQSGTPTYDGGGGGGASYDNPGGAGKLLHFSTETPRYKSNIGGTGGNASSYGCGGGGCGAGGGTGGKGAPGAVIIGY